MTTQEKTMKLGLAIENTKTAAKQLAEVVSDEPPFSERARSLTDVASELRTAAWRLERLMEAK